MRIRAFTARTMKNAETCGGGTATTAISRAGWWARAASARAASGRKTCLAYTTRAGAHAPAVVDQGAHLPAVPLVGAQTRLVGGADSAADLIEREARSSSRRGFIPPVVGLGHTGADILLKHQARPTWRPALLDRREQLIVPAAPKPADEPSRDESAKERDVHPMKTQTA
jgi:hypothetical protein